MKLCVGIEIVYKSKFEALLNLLWLVHHNAVCPNRTKKNKSSHPELALGMYQI